MKLVPLFEDDDPIKNRCAKLIADYGGLPMEHVFAVMVSDNDDGDEIYLIGAKSVEDATKIAKNVCDNNGQSFDEGNIENFEIFAKDASNLRKETNHAIKVDAYPKNINDFKKLNWGI